MSTSAEFINYVCEQLSGAGELRFRKMFGEYMVYLNDKPVVLVCDNTPFVKMLPCLRVLLSQTGTGFPYEGAKEHYILDIDNRELALDVVRILESETPIPKPRSRKKSTREQ